MRKPTIIVLSVIFAGGVLLAGIASSGDKERSLIQCLDEYRHWTHVKSMVIQQGHPLYGSFGGIHHIYANWKGVRALRSGKPFPDGAVLILEIMETRNENSSVVEGPRKLIAIMEKDSKKFMDTGGWGFEEFRGDTKERVQIEPKIACFGCHEAQKQKDYVFSEFQG